MMEYAKFEKLAIEILDETCNMLNDEGGVPPTIFVVTPSDEIRNVRIVNMPPGKLRQTVKEAVQRLEATAAIVGSKVWMTPHDEKSGLLSDHPQRQEAAAEIKQPDEVSSVYFELSQGEYKSATI